MKTLFYFLGANTADGFFSCYDSFCRKNEDFLYIIKGGPGTGKSGFLRRVGKEAEARGYNTEYVVCSGDPDSFDGIYIPEKRLGYTDGTAPHIQEPRCCGSDGTYLNFGDLLHCGSLRKIRTALFSTITAYKHEYEIAYALLPRAEGGEQTLRTDCSKRFRMAVTCKGLTVLAPPAPMESVSEARLAELLPDVEAVYLHPLNPRRAVGVLKDGAYLEVPFVLPDCSAAVSHLARAKALHDELEAMIHPYVDFSGADRLAEEHIAHCL